MRVTLHRRDGVHFVAETESGHEIDVDGAAAMGGADKGARPMEMVLVGLGGCSAIDVISILNKGRQPVSDCSVIIDAERADTAPAVFSRIHLTFELSGPGLDPARVRRAVALSVEKYCSVARMLEKTAAVTSEVRIRA